jgi:hypothetical protein
LSENKKRDTKISCDKKGCERECKKLKKGILTKCFLTLMCLMIGCGYLKIVSVAGESESADRYLSKSGMSVWAIETLDRDVRQYIADELRNSGGKEWKAYTDIQTVTVVNSEQDGVAFYITVFAFQAESDLRFYAVYESSTGIMPTGNDSIFLEVGDRFEPYEYGGQVWYKKTGDEGWIQGNMLAADCRTPESGSFSGRQLGNFQRKVLVKGCVYCYAAETSGDDNKITVEYTHTPPKENHETGIYITIVAVTLIAVLILRKRE